MTLIPLLDQIWRPSPFILAIIAVLSVVPLLKTLFFPFKLSDSITTKLNKPFGIFEIFISPIRTFVLLPYLALGIVFHIVCGIKDGSIDDLIWVLAACAIIFVCVLARHLKQKDKISLIKQAPDFLNRTPQDFFDRFISLHGILSKKTPWQPESRIDPSMAPSGSILSNSRSIDFSHLDFRKSLAREKMGAVTLATAVLNTIWATRLIIMAGQKLDDSYFSSAASTLSVIWGLRLLELSHLAISFENIENIPSGGYQIYVFTHSSLLDFSLVPILIAAKTRDYSNCLPIFLLAKDHFKDNPILYKIFGIGRVAEKLGMIFINRKLKDKKALAIATTKLAAAKVLENTAPLAIFPQGTRAYPFIGSNGENLGAGYYTTGKSPRIRKFGAHLKKGAAHIAVEAALGLKERSLKGDIHIIPVGIIGAATACPKGKVAIKSNITLKLRVEKPITITSGIVNNSSGNLSALTEDIHARIDNALKSALHIHADLERRFFEDARGIINPMQSEEISIAMKSWRGTDYLVYSILDAIYACPPKHWRPFINGLIHHMLNFSSREELLAFKGKVAEVVSL